MIGTANGIYKKNKKSLGMRIQNSNALVKEEIMALAKCTKQGDFFHPAK